MLNCPDYPGWSTSPSLLTLLVWSSGYIFKTRRKREDTVTKDEGKRGLFSVVWLPTLSKLLVLILQQQQKSHLLGCREEHVHFQISAYRLAGLLEAHTAPCRPVQSCSAQPPNHHHVLWGKDMHLLGRAGGTTFQMSSNNLSPFLIQPSGF